MIRELVIHNFKGILDADILLNKERNILVGNNGVGKSTVIEALSLVLGYGLNQLEILPSLFNIQSVAKFEEDKVPPEIIIEVYFDDEEAQGANAVFSGKNNTKHQYAFGIQLKIVFDEEQFSDIYELEKADIHEIPCEYYKVERNWFSDTKVVQRLIPYNVLLVDSTSNYFNANSNQYISNLIQKYLGDKETIKIKSGLRRLKDTFDGNEDLEKINSEISKQRKDLSISIDLSSHIITRNIICPYLDKIPVSQIGAGDLCVLKTMLTLDKTHLNDKKRIVIIEEPESHLSHTKMYELINEINGKVDNVNTQLVITTHNNFVANKLNLSNVILLNNEKGKVISSRITDNAELGKYFTKISNYPTLRLILCRAAILVEGPADEMVVTYYYHKKYGVHPFEHSIELISVEGVKFKAFVELAKNCHKMVAVVTDNDGIASEEGLIKERGLGDLPDNIKLFTDADHKNCTTLEPSLVHANHDKWESLAKIVRKQNVKDDSQEKLIDFMTGNKTEWAYRLLESVDDSDITVPKYIADAVDWIEKEHEQ